LKFFTLAFITADSANKPAWGGFSAYDVGTTDFDAQMKTNISALRAIGGDVMVSFGGAANQELAEVITDVNSLAAAYQSVITAYGLTHIDFDIEGAAAANQASIDRRSQAIAAVQQTAAAAGRKLDVWFTLPVLPSGLTADGLYVIQSALRYGVNIAGVNVMTMDYGDSAAPSPAGHMGDYAIQAAMSLFDQLKTAYNGSQSDAQIWSKIGLTPMIGLNDIQTEVFDQQEAREMLAFAQQHGISRISIWSLNRDYQNSAGRLNYVDNFSSSLLQSPLEFSLLFNQLTG
jgi:chitinase